MNVIIIQFIDDKLYSPNKSDKFKLQKFIMYLEAYGRFKLKELNWS